jgi:lysophospholipase L1-like esterase
MMRILFVVLAMFALLMCSSATEDILAEDMEEMKDDTPDAVFDTLTYLALGDSYTIGEAVEVNERWPVRLAEKFSTDSAFRIAPPQIIARTGWTTAELLQGISSATLSAQGYDLVSLLIGVNNQFRGLNENIYIREFEVLIKDAIKYANGDTSRVFVVSIPDYGVTPFSTNRNPEKIGRELDRYNQINREIAEKYNILYFDITPISREAKEDRSLVAKDGLHPSAIMYQRWVDEVIFDELRKNLAKTRD